jgi:hypothetical protein
MRAVILTRGKAILVVTIGAAIVGACGRVPLDLGGGSAGTSGSAGSGAAGTAGLPPCGRIVDETTCKARPDCLAQECMTCGSPAFTCYRSDETPPVCIEAPCPQPAACPGTDEMTCAARPGCTPVICPDCKGGQFFAGCAAPGERIGCVSCPLSCASLDEATCRTHSEGQVLSCRGCTGTQSSATCVPVGGSGVACPPTSCPNMPAPCAGLGEAACNARGDCQSAYCNWCNMRTFAGCGDPGTPFGCPTGGPVCPATVLCANVTDRLSCDARPDCHSVFADSGGVCDCATPGCCIVFSRCADGAKATCKGTPTCHRTAPTCDTPDLVVSYTADCYEGCVRPTECAP